MNSVFIATPVSRRPTWQYTRSLLNTALELQRRGVEFTHEFVVGCAIAAKARNQLVALFLASKKQSLIFIDDDMGWTAEGFMRLAESDKDVVAGVGRRRDQKVSYCYKQLKGGKTEGANVEVAAVGAAFIKIDRSAIKRMIAADPNCGRMGVVRRNAEHQRLIPYYHIFRTPDDEGEDYDFCRRFRALGGEVWVCPDIELAHVGESEFKGRLSDVHQVSRDASATPR
jgi:hypothetical protein